MRPRTAHAHAPRIARRVSGPVTRPRPVTPRKPISGATVALPAPGLLRRLAALPDHRLLDRLLRSRAWIWMMGIALGGIVAMQVSMLKLNTGISRAVQASATLERANAQLEEQVATLSSGDRIREAAAGLGLIEPDPGSVGWVTVRPGFDASRAARRMTAPSDEARQNLDSGGRTLAALNAPVAPVASAPAVTPQPVATAVPTATATPVPPAATATPAPVAQSPQSGAATGATAAPAGE